MRGGSRLCEAFGTTAAQAEVDIDRVDAARRTFAKERYKTAWGDARFYDLIIDVSRFGIAGSIDLVATAARAADAPG